MSQKIILLFALLSYSIIVSQPFMYLLALKQAQLHLDADSYTAVRQLIDAAMRSSFKYVLYAAVLSNLLLLVVQFKHPGGLAFITAAVAFLALIAEILLTLKGSLPVNDIINTWSVGHYPDNWWQVRDRWFSIFQYRQWATITGFVSLLVGAVWGR